MDDNETSELEGQSTGGSPADGTTVSNASVGSESNRPVDGDTSASSVPGTGPGAVSGNSVPGGGDTGGAAPATAPPPSVRDQFRQAGWGAVVDRFADDASFIAHVHGQQQQAQQAQALAQYGQRYLQHAGQFENFLRQQQEQAQQAAAPKKPNYFQPPEFNPSWEKQLALDEQGNIVAKPGTPPDVLPKYLAYQQYKRDFAERLTTDPVGTLGDWVQDVARQQAEELVQQQLGQYQEQVFATNFIAQNSAWLHAKDANGHLIRDFNGQPQLSAAGQRFQSYVQQAQDMGIYNSAQQERYATQLLRADLAIAQASGAKKTADATTNGQQKKDAFLKTAARSGSVTTTRNLNGRDPEQNEELTLGEKLSRVLSENGYTDESLMLGSA